MAIDITVADIPADPGLGGYNLTLTFDPSLVQLNALADAGFVTSGQNIVICEAASIDNTSGKATAACEPIPLFGQPGVTTTSPVALMHATFVAVAAGTSRLSLAGTTLETPSGSTLASSASDGTIKVLGAASPGPATATAAPPTATTTALPTPTTTTPAMPTPAVTSVPAPSPTVADGLQLPQAGVQGGGDGGSGRTALLALAGAAAALAGLGSLVLLARRRAH